MGLPEVLLLRHAFQVPQRVSKRWMPNMPRSLQPNQDQQNQQAILAATRDYVAEMMAKEFAHWRERPMAGQNAHRRFEWTDAEGKAHIVSCGAGTHREADIKEDARRLRQRIRVCESGACDHRNVVEVFGQPMSPEEAAISERNRRPEPYTVGQSVIYNEQPYYVTEQDFMDGQYVYGLLHQKEATPETAMHEELRPADSPPRQSNILDPIHDELDPDVWDYPDSDAPLLRPEHKQWITNAIYQYLDEAGYDGMDDWLSLVFTGSLTTYQYSEDSDVDVSLFVDTTVFPDWSRAEMIGVMVNHLDGTKVPGTTHPIQCFVVPPEVTKDDLYQPGLRSGYDIETDTWIQPPERDRVMDVEHEMNTAYTLALESADKMELLLKYEPQEAVRYWHYIHDKRREDQRAGKGDFAPSNIVYKMLANRGLFGEISEVSGEYIAHTSNLMYEELNDKLTRLEREYEEARAELAINWPHMSEEDKTHQQAIIADAKRELDLANAEYEQYYRSQPVYREPMLQRRAYYLTVRPEDYPFDPNDRHRLMNVVDKYDWLHTPEGEAFIMMLGGFYPKASDQVASWLARQWKEGNVQLSPGIEQMHRQGQHWFGGEQPWEVTQSRYLWPSDTMEKALRGEEVEPVQQGMLEKIPTMLQHLKDKGSGIDLNNTSYEDLIPIFDEWQSQTRRDPEAGKVVMSYPDGHTMREVRPKECPEEGQRMKNCAATFTDRINKGTHRFMSLRDPQNESVANLVLTNRGEIEDIKGKANSPLNPQYMPHVSQFLQTLPEHVMMGSPTPSHDIPDKDQYGLPVWEPWQGGPHPYGESRWYSPEQYQLYYPRSQ